MIETILKTILKNQGLTYEQNQFMDQINKLPKMYGPKVYLRQHFK